MRLQIGILCDATTAGWDNNNKTNPCLEVGHANKYNLLDSSKQVL
jgi:hypothetical protein